MTLSMPHEGLKAALAKEEEGVTDEHPLLSPLRSRTESFMVFSAANQEDPVMERDGSHITTTVMASLLTSRGTVKLDSTDPNVAPIIDPNYYATEADKYVMRAALQGMK